MDDLKMIAKSEKDLRKQILGVTVFSNDIHMDFWLKKNVLKLLLKKGN
jgi:hypothetical protein